MLSVLIYGIDLSRGNHYNFFSTLFAMGTITFYYSTVNFSFIFKLFSFYFLGLNLLDFFLERCMGYYYRCEGILISHKYMSIQVLCIIAILQVYF